MTAREIKGEIIDFEPYRVEKELEQFKNYDEKNFFADGRKYERKYGYDQEIKISEEEKAKLKAVIGAAINSKKAALGEGCESESEPEAEDKEEEG